ncbi:hypothetical protein SHIRM173S_00300 [Streptomyces hirsutus]
MDPGTHFVFGTHKDHGFVASTTALMPAHLAHWFLVREQFEPVPDSPGLYRLTASERDGPRRTRQAAQDLRRHGYAVRRRRPVSARTHTPHGPLARPGENRCCPAPPTVRNTPRRSP